MNAFTRHLSNIARLGVKELWSLWRDPMMLVLILYLFTVAVYSSARAIPETLHLAEHHLLDVAAAAEGLAHARGVHVQLHGGRAAGQHIALEVGRNVEHEGVIAGVHAGVHLAARDHGRLGEQRRVEGADDAL